MIETSETKEMNQNPQSSCICDLNLMIPISLNNIHNIYTHVCERCDGGIVQLKNSRFNHYYGYSGYDEEFEREQVDTY